MAGWKVEFLASGNIALRTYTMKGVPQGGNPKLTNEMIFTPAMADKVGFALTEKSKAATLAGAAAADDEEFDDLDDEDLDDDE